MTWGGGSNTRRGAQPTFASPSNNLPERANEQREPYSYLSSIGYCQLVLGNARRALGRTGTDFSDLFVVGPQTERIQAFLSKLDSNERAALEETSRTDPEKLRELGIVT